MNGSFTGRSHRSQMAAKTLTPSALTLPAPLRAWEYRDPLEVAERHEDDALSTIAAATAREQADRTIDAARTAQITPLSPITRRLIKRLRIRQLVREALEQAHHQGTP